jgi:hypothetical protein
VTVIIARGHNARTLAVDYTSVRMAAGPQLSQRLEQVLETISDRAFAERLRKVYVAAAHAVMQLGDMDLVKYEHTGAERAPDLSLWEEMAPVIRDTVMDVNAMLSVLREQFPPPPRVGLADAIRQTLEETGAFEANAPARTRRIEDAERALRAVGEQLAQQVTTLGERMRSPAVVSDRWNLLADIQRFRSRFRETFGDLVYLSVSAFTYVHRADVVPGFREELQAAVVVRGAVADLIRLIAARMKSVEEGEPEDVQWHAQHIERDLDAFGRTTAYKVLRAQDKRVLIEFRREIATIARLENAAKPELSMALRPFLAFVQSLQKVVNQRELLIAHDREVWASCSVKLERVEELLARDPAAAGANFEEAAKTAMELYGRDPALDAFLRKARKGHVAGLAGASLQKELEGLREILARLPMA